MNKSAPIIVTVKGHGRMSEEVGPIYRRSDLALPVVGKSMRVANLDTGKEVPGVISKVVVDPVKGDFYFIRVIKIPRSAGQVER